MFNRALLVLLHNVPPWNLDSFLAQFDQVVNIDVPLCDLILCCDGILHPAWQLLDVYAWISQVWLGSQATQDVLITAERVNGGFLSSFESLEAFIRQDFGHVIFGRRDLLLRLLL
jgi:hypothetical protein